MPDAKFLESCRIESCKASGHGGQKVNKTSSAVRLVHLPSGIEASCSESRSQSENRGKALKKLKQNLAVEIRSPVKPALENVEMSPSNQKYPFWLAFVFDTLNDCEFRISDCAAALSLSTGRFVRLLARDASAWQKVNEERARRNLPQLRFPE